MQYIFRNVLFIIYQKCNYALLFICFAHRREEKRAKKRKNKKKKKILFFLFPLLFFFFLPRTKYKIIMWLRFRLLLLLALIDATRMTRNDTGWLASVPWNNLTKRQFSNGCRRRRHFSRAARGGVVGEGNLSKGKKKDVLRRWHHHLNTCFEHITGISDPILLTSAYFLSAFFDGLP